MIGSHQPSMYQIRPNYVDTFYTKCYVKHIGTYAQILTNKIACVRVYMKLCDICIQYTSPILNFDPI